MLVPQAIKDVFTSEIIPNFKATLTNLPGWNRVDQFFKQMFLQKAESKAAPARPRSQSLAESFAEIKAAQLNSMIDKKDELNNASRKLSNHIQGTIEGFQENVESGKVES